jgi:serine/threonine protein phosphatase PrpC
LAKPLPFVQASAAAVDAVSSLIAIEAAEGLLLAVVTPVFGLEKSDRVFRIAAERLDRACHELPMDNPRRFLTRAISDLNAALFSAGNAADEKDIHQASIACLFHSGNQVTYAHIGNDRLYLLRDGLIKAVTLDHTQAQQMVDQALLKPSEARNHALAKVLLRALGRKPIIDVPVQGPFPAKKGDQYILCAKGLVRRIDDNVIGNLIASEELTDATNSICRRAEESPGEPDDVIAVQAIRFGDAAHRKVVAYNPLDNIARTLMKQDRTTGKDEITPRGWWIRGTVGLLLILYLLIFAVCDPRLDKWIGSEPDAQSSQDPAVNPTAPGKADAK